MQTRTSKGDSGHIIAFDDKAGITIKDKAGSEVHLDGEGNIIATALKNFTVNAQNIIMNASENITASAGMNISQNAGMNLSETAGAMLTQNAGADYMLTAANILEVAKGSRTAKADNIDERGKTKTSNTQGDTVFNAKTDIHTKTDGKTKFS